MQEKWDAVKRNMLVAIKSVRYNLRLYLPFFAAVFVSQLLFACLLFAAGQASREEKAIVERDYWYHVACYDLNESQALYLRRYAKENGNPSALYTVVREEEAPGSTVSQPRSTLYLMLLGDDPAAQYRQLEARYLPTVRGFSDEGESLRIAVTPLVTSDGSSATAGVTLACLLLTVLSLILLTVLYTVRINNEKFEYGIYMSFGADFRKLTENALREMLIVTVLPYLPVLAVAYGTVSLIYGKPVAFSLGGALLTLLLSLLTALSSCFFPMFVVSKIFPMKHIRAVDNSHYVTSPRLSFEMLGRSLRHRYGNVTLFRFRKYYVKIVLTACAFAVVATTVFYGADLKEEGEARQTPQFRITFAGGYGYDDELAAELHAIEGVTYVEKTALTVASDINSHLMFLPGQTVPLSGLPTAQRYDEYFSFGTDAVAYQACDAETMALLSRYEHEGDLAAVLTDDRAVIISENQNNTRVLDLWVGDKIYAAVPVGRNPGSTVGYDDLMYLQDKALFKAKLEYYEYEYIELTVAAILKDCPSGSHIPVYLSSAGYTYVTQPQEAEPTPVSYRTVDVYVAPDLTADEIARVEEHLSFWCHTYGELSLSNLQAHSTRQIGQTLRAPALFRTVAALILLLSPVIWFFSQILFYRKRRSEMDVLHAMGAIDRELRYLHLRDGLVLGILSAAVTALLGSGAVLLVHRLINRASGTLQYYHLTFPGLLLTMALLMSGLCAFFSVYLSYILYRRSRNQAPDVFSGE